MKEETRRAIAHAAARQINGKAQSTVYSYDQGRHTHMTGGAPGGAYDHDAGAHISGSSGGIYHHGLGSHISLSINGSSFSGYDYGDGHHFSGTVHGSSVQLYDHGEGRYFNYQA